MPVTRWKTFYPIQAFLLSYWLHLQAACAVSCSGVHWLAHVQVQHVSRKKKLILLCWVHKLNLAPINSNKRKCSAKEEGQDPHQLGTREGMSWRSNSWCLWCLWIIVLAGRVVLCSNLGFHTGFVGSHEVLLLCFNQFLKNVVMLLFLSTGYTFFWSMLSHPLLDFVWYGLSGRLARGRGTDWLV